MHKLNSDTFFLFYFCLPWMVLALPGVKSCRILLLRPADTEQRTHLPSNSTFFAVLFQNFLTQTSNVIINFGAILLFFRVWKLTAQNMLILFKNGIDLVLYLRTPTSTSCLPQKQVLVQTIRDYQLHNILHLYQRHQ